MKINFPDNQWYVAAWSYEVDDRPLGRSINRHPMALWRDSEGQVVAFEDACCHRGAPLSLGRCEGNALRCMYHGLSFDRDGRCIAIPGQTQIPSKARVKTYTAVERYCWVWVWPGDPAMADTDLIPDLPWLNAEQWPYRPGYYHYRAPAELINDNLLDFSHLSYVHTATLGGSDDIANTKPEVIPGERAITVLRRVSDVPPSPTSLRFASFPGNVNRWFNYEFTLPGILAMEFGIEPLGDPDGALKQYTCQAVTPESEDTAHYFFMQTRDFRLKDTELTDLMFEGLVAAFEEDKTIIEAQARVLDGRPEFVPVAIGADLALIRFRRLLEQQAEPNDTAITESTGRTS